MVFLYLLSTFLFPFSNVAGKDLAAGARSAPCATGQPRLRVVMERLCQPHAWSWGQPALSKGVLQHSDLEEKASSRGRSPPSPKSRSEGAGGAAEPRCWRDLSPVSLGKLLPSLPVAPRAGLAR